MNMEDSEFRKIPKPVLYVLWAIAGIVFLWGAIAFVGSSDTGEHLTPIPTRTQDRE